MRTIIFIGLLLIGVFGIAQTKETLTNKSIIELTKAGLGKDVILTKINTTACQFDVSTNGLLALKKANVEESVIASMVSKMSGKTEPSTNKTNSPTKTVEQPKLVTTSVTNINHPYAWIKDKGKTEALEKGTANMKAKMKIFGYGGVNTNYELDGETSPIRVSANDSLSFIVNAGGGAIPELSLYKATKVKGKRSAKVGTIQSMVQKKGDKASDAIVFTVTQVKNGFYEIKPSIKLDKGEYMFCSKITVSATSIDVFAFGID